MLYAEILRQRLKLVNAHIVADTIDYLEAKFEFRTDDWDGLDKWAHFAKDSAVYDIRLTGNCIRKEDHLNLSAGMWKVYLHGNEFRDGEVVQRITTDEVVLYVIPTGTLDGEPFPTVPPSAGEQIIASAAAAEAGAKSAADAAGRAAESAKDSADLAKKSAEIIGDAEQIVQDALRDAKESGEFDGEDGITPQIGANGNWFVGETDTGVRAQGKDGAKGDPGDDYTLTAEDKQEIAGLIPGGGNVGNVLILVGGASLDRLRIEFVAPPAGVSVEAAYELIGRGLFDVAVQVYSDDGNDLIGIGILRGMPVSDAVGAIGEFWSGGNVSLVNVTLDFAAMTAYAEVMYTASGGTSVEIDDALTISGAAADAKAVGDKLSEVSEAKVNLPTNADGTPNHGTAGYYAVSDGAGGIKWVASGNTGGGTDTPVTPNTHGIVWDLVNVTSSNPIASVSDGASLIAVLTAADGYTLGDVIVTMGGEALTGAWNADTATVTIASVTGDVIVSAAGVAKEVLDTSPKIAVDNASTDRTGGTVSNAYCFVTEFYNTPRTLETSGDYANLVYCITSVETDGGSTPNVQCFNGETFTTYWTQITGTTPQEKKVSINGGYGVIDRIRLTVYKSCQSDAYAYWRDTGDILFAGKNSPYYGMKNIKGNSVTTPTLSVDDDYAMDYGVSTASIITDGANSSKTGIDVAYAAVIEEAKNAWMLECNGNIDKIPLIVHTDQHSNYRSSTLFDFISEIVNWYDVGKVINLGDTAGAWGDADPNRPGVTCTDLENYITSMASVPYSKRIEVFGNHDACYPSTADVEHIGITPQNHLYKYFRNIHAKRADNYGNFVVYDDNYNVKYLAISGFAYDYDIGSVARYIINSDSIRWIIAEMEKADGYDLIILSHVPLGATTATVTNPINGTTASMFIGGVSFKLLTELWTGRKDKTAGTVTGEYGITYEFDFTKCNGELLCGLHGHMHEDGYYYIGNLLDAYFDAYYTAPRSFFFTIIDRENRCLNVWKVDETPQYVNYQIPFDKPAE